MCPCGGCEGRLQRAERLRRTRGQQHGVAVVGDPEGDVRAERVSHPGLDVRDGCPEGGGADPQRAAVQVAVVPLRRPPVAAPAVQQRVAAFRLTDGAAVERLRAGALQDADRSDYEREPEGDRLPGMGGAPAADCCNGMLSRLRFGRGHRSLLETPGLTPRGYDRRNPKSSGGSRNRTSSERLDWSVR